MKRFFISAFMAMVFGISINAQTVITNDYGSPITGADGQSINDDDDTEGFGSLSLTYYDSSIFGLNFRGQNWDAMGFELNFLTDDSFGVLIGNININYSIGLWKASEKKFLLTLAAGPTLNTYKDGSDTKTNSSLFLDPYLTFKVNKFTISAGYAFMFNKWKFENPGKSFHFGIGYCF